MIQAICWALYLQSWAKYPPTHSLIDPNNAEIVEADLQSPFCAAKSDYGGLLSGSLVPCHLVEVAAEKDGCSSQAHQHRGHCRVSAHQGSDGLIAGYL